MFLRLGQNFGISDMSTFGEPGRAFGQSGYGIPRWGQGRLRNPVGPMKPMPIGARYFCADCESVKENKPVAMGHKFGATKSEYQAAITAHMTENHPDLHYPLPQDQLDMMLKRKNKQKAIARTNRDLGKLQRLVEKHPELFEVSGGVDVSSSYQAVKRPRELPDFSEFDFPDAAVADDGIEEIEFDQLISIQARQGRRLLGIEVQNLDIELVTEFLTAPDNADLQITWILALNTRTGAHNLDDPEQLWRYGGSYTIANVEATAGAGTAINMNVESRGDVPVGGRVYVAPRAFWRFSNSMDRQVDAGDLFGNIVTIDQPLGTFLLFELLEQYSGLFGLT